MMKLFMGSEKWLLGASYPMNLTFIGEIDLYNPSILSPKMDHLVCFMAGNLALGATEGLPLRHRNGTLAMDLSPWDQENMSLAESLAEACWYTYTMNPTGLAAEISVFNTLKTKTKDAFVKPADTHNLLRPETIESLFILWRITKDPKYREWGWEMFLSFEQHTKVEHGYVALSDATVIPPVQRGKMETFFLAETLKYFYLLFSADDFLHLDKVVFNTEAHPLPRFTPRKSFLIHHSPAQGSIVSLVWQKFLKLLANITANKTPPSEDSVKLDVSTSTGLDDFDQDDYSDDETEQVEQESDPVNAEDGDSKVDGLNSHILNAFRSIHDTVTTTVQPKETDLP
ncbi:hypothetical protein DSO57_1033961 [Entomophthora muscae]|uniref:Uncharacterized protein n=1 Tax=Entomophthora muscae TaxID=34485 RepID=A0ACC2U9P9_9FUNG|nr:hypothetical protein DSO57_1033961 [Entomophthora muscae]